MILSDEQVRKLAIDILSMPSARTMQKRVGPSNLSNQCDRDLAYDLLGIERHNPQADKTWLGAEIGTGIHAHGQHNLDDAIQSALAANRPTPAAIAIAETAGKAKAERRVYVGEIPGYGVVHGTIDLDLEDQIGDWKGSTRKKSCILQDYIAIANGLPAPFGRGHSAVKLSQAQYEAEMSKMEYKMTGYYGQQNLYMRGREIEGRPVDRGSIIWVNRDGTGYFDVPSASGYDDPKRVHDVWVLTFAYNRDYAEHLLARAGRIWAQLEAGASPTDFDAHEHCWACSFDEKEAAKPEFNLDAPIFLEEAA